MAHAFQSRFQLALKINQAWSLVASDAAGFLEQATEEATADGIDPWSDPAVVLILARLALLAGVFNADPLELIEHCRSKVQAGQDSPLLLQLLCDGLDADPRRQAEYALEVECLLRELASHLGYRRSDYAIRIRPGGTAGDAIATLDGPSLHLRVCAAPPAPGSGIVFHARHETQRGDDHVAPLEALREPRQLAARICTDLGITPRRDRQL